MEADAFLVEIHRDPACGFALTTFVCPGCAELIATGGHATLRAAVALGVGAPSPLRCTSPPRTVAAD